MLPGDVGKVLILHGGALGDCVLTLHVAAALRAALPGARLEMAARSGAASFAVGCGSIDAALDPDDLGLHHFYGVGDVPAAVVGRLNGYDLIVSFLGGADWRITRRLQSQLRCEVIAVEPAADPVAPETHITEQWVEQLGRQGLVVEVGAGAILQIAVEERGDARAALGRLVGGAGGRLVVCHPGSGGRAKCCPLAVFEGVLDGLRGPGDAVLWMVGPTELDWYGAGFCGRLARTAPVIYEESVPRAARLLSGADVFIGNDAGMTHVAAALGLRTIALFGPTRAEVWEPPGPLVTSLRFGDGEPGEGAG